MTAWRASASSARGVPSADARQYTVASHSSSSVARRAPARSGPCAIVPWLASSAAVRATELLEWAATVYWRASALGEPRALDAAQRQAVVEAALGRGYGRTRPAEAS